MDGHPVCLEVTCDKYDIPPTIAVFILMKMVFLTYFNLKHKNILLAYYCGICLDKSKFLLDDD